MMREVRLIHLRNAVYHCQWHEDLPARYLVHQVSDWGSGVAIKMGRRQGDPSRTGGRKEHIWIDT